jgi:peptidoglycan/LPS O-acetylase OafA/YrhL
MLVFAIVAIFVTPERRTFFTLPIAAAATIFLLRIPTLACFILGYMLAECYHSSLRENSLVRYVAPALLPLVIGIKTARPYFDTTDSCDALLAAASVFSIVFTPIYGRCCSSRLSAFLGQISFPLYLIQIPIICSYTSFLLLKFDAHGVPLGMAAAINIGSSMLLALLIAWLMVPLERFSIRFSTRAGVYLVDLFSIRKAPVMAAPPQRDGHVRGMVLPGR